MRRRFLALLAGGLLAGCASVPPPAGLPARDRVSDFSLDARFALRVTPAGEPPHSSAGRLNWTHSDDSDHILVSNPLGYGVAEIDSGPSGATLRTSDGKLRWSADPNGLMEEATGQRLPVRRLPAWLLGRADGDGQIERDRLDRPSRLTEDGWRIDYGYPDDSPGALPSRLTLNRSDEIELRLRIENWMKAR